jgi:hypothetical protein
VPINPLARRAAVHLFALNAAVREIAARHGALLVDLETHRVASDPRLWDLDRLHGNPEGHRRIAAAASELLGLPGADHAWADALPPAAFRRRHEALAADTVWAARYLRPWLMRRVRGRSSGDGRSAKRPEMLPW